MASKYKNICFIIVFILWMGVAFSQTIRFSSKTEIPYPFAGGLNAVQFGEVDINRDGKKDLLVFDRHGNKKLCYINQGLPGVIDYQLDNSFSSFFPDFDSWVIFRDYNQDGKADIFTFSPPAGIKVYKNISGSALEFELVVYPFLNSTQNGVNTNIFVTPGDYPAIEDLDGDGDLDMLTFSPLGAWVDMHRNKSMELYGNSDSLVYEKSTSCWGHFAESEESNVLFLDTCDYVRGEKEYRHTGSTFLVLPDTVTGLPDVVLGDIDYASLIYLHNGGEVDEAFMDSYTDLFPVDENPVQLFSFPVAAHIDVNNDGLKDVLVSTFDSRPEVCNNYESVWLYLNDGAQYQLVNRRFLQDEMIDAGAYSFPFVGDINQDGNVDMVIGNFGYFVKGGYHNGSVQNTYRSRLIFFQGTQEGENIHFQERTKDLASLSGLDTLGLAPAMGDLDHDGDMDMICGLAGGGLVYCENTGVQDGIPVYASPVLHYQNIDVGKNSTPCLFDVNRDGLLDLVIGGRNGKLSYYQNTGTVYVPDFTLVDDYWGEVNVTASSAYFGYSCPALYLDMQGHIHLLVGSASGDLYYYPDIEDNISGVFNLSGDFHSLLGLENVNEHFGVRTSPFLVDINQDHIPELLVGNSNGGLHFVSLMNTPGVDKVDTPGGTLVRIYPNPAKDFLIINTSRLIDINIYDVEGHRVFSRSSIASRINVSTLNDGVYLVQVRVAGKKYSQKIVIKK